jgi:hypothetical protein
MPASVREVDTHVLGLNFNIAEFFIQLENGTKKPWLDYSQGFVQIFAHLLGIWV